MIRYLDGSPSGRFTPLDVLISGRFATSLNVLPSVCDTVRSLASLSSGGKKSREVAKCSGAEMSMQRTIQVAKRPGSKSPNVVAKRPGGELAKQRNILLPSFHKPLVIRLTSNHTFTNYHTV